MADSPTLPLGPFEYSSMDHARLREEGVRLLGALASAQWTDFNVHDPGITILEQLCYAITDLGYRLGSPMPDLLPADDVGMPRADAILTTDPVTRADICKIALDVEGVKNAWVDGAAGAALPFYHDAASGQLVLRVAPTDVDAQPVQLRGVERVLVQTTDQLTGERALDLVAGRLHAARALGGDVDVQLVGMFEVGLRATLEVGPVGDPAALAAAILDGIESYLAPRARFASVADARHQGLPIETVLDGPLLAHGFIEALPGRRRVVHGSDLLHAILDVKAVKAVRELELRGPSGSAERWALEVPAGAVATLAPDARLTLLRNGLPLRVDPDAVRQRFHHLRDLRAARARAAVDGPPAAPAAPPRDLTRFRSVQYQLPAAYGVGPVGLPRSTSATRRAQARQLAAYLLIFDQLFANTLAQIAHAQDLLSPVDGPARTYFALPVEDERLGLDELLARDPASQRAWLETAVESSVEAGDPANRQERFLAHLLARFAEEPSDHERLIAPGASAGATDLLIADRRAFLREYARLGRARGSGYDVSRYDAATSSAGFEDRLRHKLGLRDQARLHVVEHVLLRPVVEDQAQLADEGDPQVPLLAGVTEADPWSLHISVVIAEPVPGDEDFEDLVRQTIAAETPAHLVVQVHWLGSTDGVDDWAAFVAAWHDFRAAYRAYRAYRALALHIATMPPLAQLHMRDARDRLIDLLGFGRTYPLRDLPLPELIVVTQGARATIELEYSQADTTYQLADRDTGAPIEDQGAPIIAGGTGGRIALTTPPIDADVAYRVRAVKREGAGTDQERSAWLLTAIRVVEGVDPSIVAEIVLPLLDPQIDDPRPIDARIGDYNVAPVVEVLASQDGVTYELIADAADLSDPSKHRVVSEPVVGTGRRIELRAAKMPEDIDLRVRGKKVTGSAANPVTRTAVLDVVMPLRVRANPRIGAELVPAFVAYGGGAVVRTGATQATAAYRVYRARVRDRDVVVDEAPGAPPTIDVTVDGGRIVRVARPAQPSPWADLAGFTAVADAAPGTGAALDLPIGEPGTADSFLLVQASKQHQTGRLGAGSATLPSAVQLDAALALLVGPNPDPGLRMTVSMKAGATTGTLQVTDGQAGVFYTMRLDGQTARVGLPAYMHQRDDRSDLVNKGIDQLRVEVDLAVTRDPPAPAPNPGAAVPLAPLIATAALTAGSVLRVGARKAMTGLTAPLARRAVLDDVPAVTAPAQVARGASASISIAASHPGERYWLSVDDTRVSDIVTGTGAPLVLSTGPVSVATVFSVVASAPAADDTIPVERRVDVAIGVLER